jgi:hypothetical protein
MLKFEAPTKNQLVDTQVVDRMRAFVKHHPTGGSRPTQAQQAIDAILTASTFTADTKSLKLKPVANRLGVARQTLLKRQKGAVRMLESTSMTSYKHPVRKQRSDCIRDDATVAVLLFCHSEESSNLDTNSFKFISVLNTLTGVKDIHPLRVWHHLTVEEQLDTFHQSRAYSKFQEKNPGRTIGKDIFRDSICNCVKLPGSESCVDIYLSSVKYYMKALNIKAVQDILDSCECDAHTQLRNYNTQEEQTINQNATTVVWDSYLSGRPEDMIQGTCCKAEEQPSLCLEIGQGKPPKMIPWKCTHGLPVACQECDTAPDDCSHRQTQLCNNCGVHALKMMDCEAVVNCDKVVQVMEWKLAPRAGYNKKGEQNTQLEVTEGNEKVSTILIRLLESLAAARKHYNELQWSRIVRNIQIDTLQDDELFILTDFSATMDLKARQTDTCSQDAHAVLDVLVV